MNGPLALGGAKQRALLALLLLNANRVVSRERLIDGLWGEEPPETAVTTVQVYVSRLRRLLPEGVLVTRLPGYVLEVAPDELDLERFERLRASGDFAAALALWRGPALGEFGEPFARVEGARLDDLRLSTLEERIDADLARGRSDDLPGELEALISEHPHRERLRAQLMRALYRAGRQAESLEAYRDARAALDELGIEPGDELRELERMILTHDPDLGAPSRTPAALPTWPTPFVGRSHEVEAARALIAGGHRLVTLSGPGGVGKTRLAASTAERVRDGFPDGAFFVPLADARDPAAVRPAIAEVLDVRPGESLDVFLSSRELLLVLDNFEQLVDGGAVLVADLLRDAPRVSILVTSREPLRVRGEHVHAVPPLGEDEALDLFAARARDADDAFRLTESNRPAVEDVCERLDGLPLALELAAAHVRTLTPAAMLSRLDRRLAFLAKGPRDAPSRQQTIRATIEWSYLLLVESQRRLFARLACFAGGFTIGAAEAVCEAQLEEVEALVDKNLVQPDGERFRMLETVREFAGEKLAEAEPGGETRARHARYFAALVERAYADRFDGGGVPEDDFDNVDVALDQLFEHDRVGYLALASAFSEFTDITRHGGDWMRLKTAVDETTAHPATRARALLVAGTIANVYGDDAAVRLAEDAVALYRELGATAAESEALQRLAYAHRNAGNDREMRAAAEEALRVAERADDAYEIAGSRGTLCQIFVADEDADRAEPLARELFESAPLAGVRREAMHFLADCALIREDYDLAAERYVAAVDVNWLAGVRLQVQTELLGVAMAASGRGDAWIALRLFGAAEGFFADFEKRWSPTSFWRRWIERYRDVARAALGDEAEQAVQDGRTLTPAAAVALAHTVVASPATRHVARRLR